MRRTRSGSASHGIRVIPEPSWDRDDRLKKLLSGISLFLAAALPTVQLEIGAQTTLASLSSSNALSYTIGAF